MSTQGASSSSAPSFSTPRWNYDVFLNFSSKDTRRGFTDHLYTALAQKGVFTYRDDGQLKRGESISAELLKAIQESRIAIVILSENYASSTWCLDELAMIVKCKREMGLIILPVFYLVNPSEVRRQTGAFQQAFAKHEVSCDRQKVSSWRDALTDVANLAGWTVNERIIELDVIHHIVEYILGTQNTKFLSSTKHLVGLDSPMQELITSYLAHENSVFMLGIHGQGGIGKTTLARVIYGMVCNRFQGSGFIDNIREVSKNQGLDQVQKQILEQILKERNIDIRDVHEGVDMIKNRLCHKKVILVLDDVNELDQLKKLAGHHDWFGLGSWIIIISRDKKLLEMHGVDKIYKLNELNDLDALKLFCVTAFKNEQPAEDYMQLCQDFIKYCKGLPLAILVIGSYLAGRTMDEWESTLYRLSGDYFAGKIQDVLKISFYGLEEMWKEIFLDIACFFCGKMRDQVIEILEICGFHARIGIDVLLDKSLLRISNNKLLMHDLIREMGEGIVRQESVQEPGKRSRLWLCEDLFHVMMNDTATEAIQAIVLDGFEGNELNWNSKACRKAFSKMCNLRLLIINNVHVPNGLKNVFKDLRFLQWSGYSSRCLPSRFQSKELVELKLWYSKIKYLWRGIKGLLYPKTSTKRKDGFKAAFQIIIPGLEVPQWLTHQRFGYSICIELPPNWCNSRWMGFVLCAFFRYNCSGYSSERYSLKGHVTALGDMPRHTIKVPFFEAVIRETSFDYSVGHLWLFYCSRDDLLGTHSNDCECSRLKVVFDSNSPSVEVIKCAARLIYEQDVEELNQTIAQTQAILDTDITARLSKCPSDSLDKHKGKRKLRNSQMNDALQSMDEANKVRIEANKTKAERYKRPRVETTDLAAFAVPPFSSALTSAAGGVTLEAIMAQLQRMEADFGGRLDYLTNEMCQMDTRVGHIACRQVHMAGFAPSPSPERLAASTSVDDEDEDEDDAGSFGDDEMTTSQ